MSNERTIRLQVPIPGHMAAEIARLGQRMDRSQSWMAAQLLDQAVLDRKRLVDWLGMLLVGGVTRAVDAINGHLGETSMETTRLKVWVSEQLAADIEALGKRIRLNQVQMAGLLLECAVRDHHWVIEVVSTRVGKALAKALYGKRESITGETTASAITPCDD